MKWGIANIKGVGGASNTMLTTTTDATENSGTYTLALSYLSDTPKVNDFIAYVNSGAITTLYQVSAVGSTNATLTKIGDIGGGGGSQLYQHNILCRTSRIAINIMIINNSNTPINSVGGIWNFLYNNGYTSTTNIYPASGGQSPDMSVIYGVYCDSFAKVYGRAMKTSGEGSTSDFATLVVAITDIVVAI